METTYEIWQRKIHPMLDEWGPYEKVWEGTAEGFEPTEVRSLLEDLFYTFNVAHPPGFTGHSLSVQDMVVIGETSWRCAPVGWEPDSHPTLHPASTPHYFL